MKNKIQINKNRLGVCHTFKDPQPHDIFLSNTFSFQDLGIQAQTDKNPNKKIPFALLKDTQLVRFDSSNFPALFQIISIFLTWKGLLTYLLVFFPLFNDVFPDLHL